MDILPIATQSATFVFPSGIDYVALWVGRIVLAGIFAYGAVNLLWKIGKNGVNNLRK